jgi:predicted NAD/FAD-binding protein
MTGASVAGATGPSGPRGASPRERIAVVGSGVSGLTAAYLLARVHDVILFEADERLGGHAHTHSVAGSQGPLAVDSGFIVFNDRTYPVLQRLFAELGVQGRPTEMSMSVRDDVSGIEFAGGRGLPGFVARPRQLIDPAYWRMLTGVRRFHRLAREFLAQTDDEDTTTLGEFVRAAGFGPDFIRLYAVPVVACVWSTGGGDALDYPARYLFRFLDHHGMLSIGDSPQWFTVVGGSRSYVDAIAARLPDIRRGRPVRAVLRHPDRVEVIDAAGGRIQVDRVVIATHPDQALSLLADPLPLEEEVLGAFRYSTNEAVLHRDPSLLPLSRGAQASWNYLVRGDREPAEAGPPMVTYWMNRLQGLPTSDPLFVTLNGSDRISPEHVVASMTYDHPLYDVAAVRAQRRLAQLSVGRTAYAGAYHGWGFHEDGARSGVAAAAALGVTW